MSAIGAVLLLLVGVWGVKLALLVHSVEVYGTYWSQPRGQAGGLLYVALGDSAAQGIGASRPELGYVGLLGQHMRDQTGRPVQIINLSSSGATISDLVEQQLPRLAGLRPDIVTVAIGGNDVRAYDSAVFSAYVTAMTTALPAGTFVADVPYFMHFRWEDRADEASEVVTTSAQARGLPVVGLHDVLMRRGADAMLTDFAPDWFHPNDRGYRVWADAFWQQIQNSPVLARDHTRLSR